MKDKHFLLNSWLFFRKHISQIVSHLQRKAMQVYSSEQILCSQRAFRLCSLDHNLSYTRSLVKLTACAEVFAELHLWFTWLLSTGAKRLEEQLPVQIEVGKSTVREGKVQSVEEDKQSKGTLTEGDVCRLKRLREAIGRHDFQKVMYSTVIGRQVVVRGPKTTVESVIKLLVLFLPGDRVRCQEFGYTYKTADVCNIVGVDLCAAVPKSSDTILRLDILPCPELGTESDLDSEYELCKFIVRNECELPKKLPTFVAKLEKVLSDESLTNRVVWLYIKSLIEEWCHVAKVIREVKKNKKALCVVMGLMQSLGVQEQDKKLIEFWTSEFLP